MRKIINNFTLNARQDVGNEVTTFIGTGVAARGRLIICAPINIVKNGRWETAPRKPPKIIDIMAFVQSHSDVI